MLYFVESPLFTLLSPSFFIRSSVYHTSATMESTTETPSSTSAPEVSTRIALLRYMVAHPELRRKVKANKLAARLPVA